MRLPILVPVLAAATLLAQQSTPPVVEAERAWAGADVVLPLTRTSDAHTTAAALRALGRLEDPALVPQLLPFADSVDSTIRSSASRAIAQSFQNSGGHTDPALLATVVDRLERHTSAEDSTGVGSLGAIAYPNAEFVARIEAILDRILDKTTAGDSFAGVRATAVSAFESLMRRNARVPGVTLDGDTVGRLEGIVQGLHPNDRPEQRLYALLTMIQAGVLTPAAERAALTDVSEQSRRIAIKTLGSAAALLDASERTEAIRHAFDDDSVLVRYEAVQAYAKAVAASQGCLPLLEALRDPSPHVVDAALDALGTACPGDEDVSVRVAAESRAPAGTGEWQREAHAFVALARRDPDRARVIMQAFAGSPVWQARMYAARAAAALKDDITLRRLAMDANDNVREAALAPLQSLVHENADPAVLDALSRSDPQLLRTAARLVSAMPPSHALYRPLADAFLRLTREHSQTTRDARLALLDAVQVHGGRDDASDLVSAVDDVDHVVAERVASLLGSWGRTVVPHTIPIVRSGTSLDPRGCVMVEMRQGGRFRMMMSSEAPITASAFLSLALVDKLYDGLTFHRVEPNFVIQGGSPGANEYSSGLKAFLRDEIGLPNVRGAVGLSTRGRNTGDGQIYILLVDEPRLNGQYTIFAHVFDSDMTVVDDIQEGDTIAKTTAASCSAIPNP